VVLHGDEPGPTVLALQAQRLGELPRVHRRGAEVADLAGLHQVAEGLQGLLERCRVVVAVHLVQVDVVGAEPPEAVVDLGHDRLARQASAVGAWPHRVAQLGRDDDVVPVGEVAQRPPEDLLARPLRVHVRGVEEVDPGVQCVLDQRSARLLAERPDRVPAVGLAIGHRPDRDGRHVETGGAELAVLHGSSFNGMYRRALRLL
jgi:hypothetical protein